MKLPLLLLLISLLTAVNLSAQKVTYHTDDTVRTPDASDPGKEYVSIYNHKGNITAQGTLVNGKREGLWRLYSAGNGMLSQISEYKNGVISGANITFGANGMVTADETFRNDKLHGTRTLMNKMGRIKAIENYSDGILNGVKKIFYDDGKPQEDGKWVNGQRDGITTWYNSKGQPTLQYTYSNGVLQGEVREYDDQGNILRIGQYRNNLEENEIVIYTTFTDFGKMQKKLEDSGIAVSKSSLERIPTSFAEISEQQVDEVLELVERFEEDDDVQAVYHNLK